MSTAKTLSRGFLALGARPASRTVFDLAAETSWSAPGSRGGIAIRCERGSVWVTVEGDPVDHIVVAPGAFSTRRHGRVAALALEPARISVERS